MIQKINIGEFSFECRISGQEGNELVILLHGFPESSIMWKGLMEELSQQGFFCIAPNQRGYSPGASPKGAKHYSLDKLTGDILAIADHFNKEKFHLIGHDWGAAIGWNLVYHNPGRILSWSGLSIPHVRAFGKALKTDPEQKKKSRYIGLFLIPLLPEFMIRRNDFKTFRKLWSKSSSEEVEDYLNIFKRKGALTAALNYYRANIGKGKSRSLGKISSPTLFVYGKKDLAIGNKAAEYNQDYMEGDYTYVEIDGGHWLIQTNYQEVKTAILNQLSRFRKS